MQREGFQRGVGPLTIEMFERFADLPVELPAAAAGDGVVEHPAEHRLGKLVDILAERADFADQLAADGLLHTIQQDSLAESGQREQHVEAELPADTPPVREDLAG